MKKKKKMKKMKKVAPDPEGTRYVINVHMVGEYFGSMKVKGGPGAIPACDQRGAVVLHVTREGAQEEIDRLTTERAAEGKAVKATVLTFKEWRKQYHGFVIYAPKFKGGQGDYRTLSRHERHATKGGTYFVGW